jgi:hypothetical protein
VRENVSHTIKKNGEFVVFQRHQRGETPSLPDTYHGYSVKWEDLRNEEKAALIKNDVVNHRGEPQ